MRGNIRHRAYVCTPSNVSIAVDYIPERSGNEITFFIDNIAAFTRFFRVKPASTKKEIDHFTKQICTMFFRNLSKSIFTNTVEAKDYLKAKYIYENIQKLNAKTGITIWDRQL